MKQKRYWLVGLKWALGLYVLNIIITLLFDKGGWGSGFEAMLAAIFTLPILPLGCFVGWIVGRAKHRKQADAVME